MVRDQRVVDAGAGRDGPVGRPTQAFLRYDVKHGSQKGVPTVSVGQLPRFLAHIASLAVEKFWNGTR
ncbi:hypothetical protein NtRootA1_43800 [Arthrobacter sp. NtRootA1]|nr:hypothetical protein NtRootA1_43800 [Arthrobacter sp. NtRootA1]